MKTKTVARGCAGLLLGIVAFAGAAFAQDDLERARRATTPFSQLVQGVDYIIVEDEFGNDWFQTFYTACHPNARQCSDATIGCWFHKPTPSTPPPVPGPGCIVCTGTSESERWCVAHPGVPEGCIGLNGVGCGTKNEGNCAMAVTPGSTVAEYTCGGILVPGSRCSMKPCTS